MTLEMREAKLLLSFLRWDLITHLAKLHEFPLPLMQNASGASVNGLLNGGKLSLKEWIQKTDHTDDTMHKNHEFVLLYHFFYNQVAVVTDENIHKAGYEVESHSTSDNNPSTLNGLGPYEKEPNAYQPEKLEKVEEIKKRFMNNRKSRRTPR